MQSSRHRIVRDIRLAFVYVHDMPRTRELVRALTLRCTSADIVDASAVAKRLGFASTSESLRALIRFLATADEMTVRWLRERL